MAVDIVNHCCFMFDRGVVHIVVSVILFPITVLRFDRGVVHIVVAGYIVDHYRMRFHRGVGGSYCCGWLYCRPLLLGA